VKHNIAHHSDTWSCFKHMLSKATTLEEYVKSLQAGSNERTFSKMTPKDWIILYEKNLKKEKIWVAGPTFLTPCFYNFFNAATKATFAGYAEVSAYWIT
jgi:hypothetical protein